MSARVWVSGICGRPAGRGGEAGGGAADLLDLVGADAGRVDLVVDRDARDLAERGDQLAGRVGDAGATLNVPGSPRRGEQAVRADDVADVGVVAAGVGAAGDDAHRVVAGRRGRPRPGGRSSRSRRSAPGPGRSGCTPAGRSRAARRRRRRSGRRARTTLWRPRMGSAGAAGCPRSSGQTPAGRTPRWSRRPRRPRPAPRGGPPRAGSRSSRRCRRNVPSGSSHDWPTWARAARW